MLGSLDIDFDNLDNANNWNQAQSNVTPNKVESLDLSQINSLLDFFLINGRLPLELQLQENNNNK